MTTATWVFAILGFILWSVLMYLYGGQDSWQEGFDKAEAIWKQRLQEMRDEWFIYLKATRHDD